ncbi:hypothetical protein [Marinitoga lauensis]|uniref:hypothetical protein n=1 Tax=Marinitoga lauensis TaxID=2201189 RepID=UPI0010122BAD|nr:hypothetical protein [Marinitoga lauensis]
MSSIDYTPVENEIIELKNIIDSPEPYSKIRNIPELIQKIENHEKEQLFRLKDEFKNEFENHFNSLLLENNFSEGLKDKIELEKIKILNSIENEESLLILKAYYHTWLNIIDELKNKVEEEKNKRAYTGSDDPSPGKAAPQKNQLK